MFPIVKTPDENFTLDNDLTAVLIIFLSSSFSLFEPIISKPI